MLNRRDVLGLAVSAGTAAWAGSGHFAGTAECRADGERCSSGTHPEGTADGAINESAAAGPAETATFPIVDTNVSLFRWPFRRLPLEEPDALVRRLRALGITTAWAGSFEAVLHRDLAGVNQRLAAVCRAFPELIPIGAVNPALSGWREDLRRCAEDFHMPGVRLLPGYHGYTLDDVRFAELLERAAEAGLFVQVGTALEDVRTQSDLVRVADVDLTPLAQVLPGAARARVQILNHRLRLPLQARLAELPGLYFDTARVDGTDAVPQLVQRVPPGRVLFGSHAPFLVPEAALIRTHESGRLDESGLRAVLAGNARALLEATRR